MTTTEIRMPDGESEVRFDDRKLKIMLADDPSGLAQLHAVASSLNEVEILASVSSRAAAREIIQNSRPDLLIVNVELGSDSGFDVAAVAGDAEIAFLALSNRFAAEAFQFNAVGYLVKPVRSNTLMSVIVNARERKLAKQALEAARRHPAGPPATHGEGFWVNNLGRTIFVPLSAITWIEAHGEYVRLHASENAYLVRFRMHDLEDWLQSRRLLRIHRSAFVRPDHVVELKRDGNRIVSVRLRCGRWVAVGARYAKLVRALLGFHK